MVNQKRMNVTEKERRKVMNHVDSNQTVTEDNDKIMIGKLLQNVKVLGVYDSNGQVC